MYAKQTLDNFQIENEMAFNCLIFNINLLYFITVFENRASKWALPKPPTASSTSYTTSNTASLLSDLIDASRHNTFEHCVDDWHLTRMPYFDDAYSSVADNNTFVSSGGKLWCLFDLFFCGCYYLEIIRFEAVIIMNVFCPF